MNAESLEGNCFHPIKKRKYLTSEDLSRCPLCDTCHQGQWRVKKHVGLTCEVVTAARKFGHGLRILLPDWVADSIIGPGGNNIERLRTKNKAIIKVPDCDGPVRQISITADDEETTLNMLSQILPYFKRAMKNEPGRDDDAVDMLEVRFIFHQIQVECIVGKTGGQIEELRQNTGAKIIIETICFPVSRDRVVAVTGSVEMILNVGKQIIGLVHDYSISEIKEKRKRKRYSQNYNEMNTPQYGGIKKASEEHITNVGGGGKKCSPMVGDGGKKFSPNSSGLESGSRMLKDGGPRIRWSGTPIRYGLDGEDEPHRGGGNHYDSPQVIKDEPSTTQVTIPNEFVGAIIGKGGCRISHVREKSGACIKIPEALPSEPDTIITISGAPDQINAALYLLQQSVADN